jgi:hypothetical protein
LINERNRIKRKDESPQAGKICHTGWNLGSSARLKGKSIIDLKIEDEAWANKGGPQWARDSASPWIQKDQWLSKHTSRNNEN